MNDLHKLMLTAERYGDLRLRFTPDKSTDNGSYTDVYCHSFLLAARSSYFRKLLKIKWKQVESNKDSKCGKFLTLQMDSNIFSHQYFRFVLNVMYTDQIDLTSLSVNDDVSSSSLSPDTASQRIKDYIKLYQIARFIDFPLLLQGCERALLDLVNSETFLFLFKWSSKPHGSTWLRRQLVIYASENFIQLAHTNALIFIDQEDLKDIIRSDFINAPEIEIFQLVMRWGEERVIEKQESSDSTGIRSIFSRGTSSSSHRYLKQRNLILNANAIEIKRQVDPLLVHVRFQHLLPINHQVVTTAIRRKIIHRPIYRHHPLDLVSRDTPEASTSSTSVSSLANLRSGCWLREHNDSSDFQPPRLCRMLFCKAKEILSELKSQLRTTTTTDVSATVRNKGGPHKRGSTMVSTKQFETTSHLSTKTHRFSSVSIISMATTRLKFVHSVYPVCSTDVASRLLARERHLRQRSWIRQILNICCSSNSSTSFCPCTTREVVDIKSPGYGSLHSRLCHLCRSETYLRLIIVREHGLDDVMTDIIRRPHLYYDTDELSAASSSTDSFKSFPVSRSSSETPSSITHPDFDSLIRHKRSQSSSSASSSSSSINSSIRPHASSQPGALLLITNSSSTDSVTVCDLHPGRNVPDVAVSADSTMKSNSGVLKSNPESSLSMLGRAEASFIRGRASASAYAKTLHREVSRKLRMTSDEKSRASTDDIRTKSLPNFRSMRKHPPVPVVDPDRSHMIPQILIDGIQHPTGVHQQIPDLYACNSLPLSSGTFKQIL